MSASQGRALRKLLRYLITTTGAVAADLAAAPRRASQPSRKRLLYRKASTLTDSDLDRLVADIGVDRLWPAVERATQPKIQIVAAE